MRPPLALPRPLAAAPRLPLARALSLAAATHPPATPSPAIDAVLALATKPTAAVLSRVLAGGADATAAEAAALLTVTGPDVTALTAAADELRRQQVGPHVTYVVNRNINFTNACVKRCGFCAFSRTATEGTAYWLPIEEVARRAAEAAGVGATEVCIQAGLPPAMPPGLYEDTVRAVREAAPGLHVHAFSPEEVTYAAGVSRSTVREVLTRLRDAGVGSLPGTSAEVLDDAVREAIAPGRLTTAQWVEVVTTAHALGLPTTSTLMFGHLESPGEVAGHLALLRGLQARTGGFTEFVPLSFVAAEAPMWREAQAAQARVAARTGGRGGGGGGGSGAPSPGAPPPAPALRRLRGGPTGLEVLRTHAVARVVLGRHIPNLQVSWVKEGLRMAQLLLGAGVNDLGGTLVNESISTSAGAGHGQLVRPSTLRSLARDAGRVPAQRNTGYAHLRVFPPTATPEEADAEAAGEPLEPFREGDPAGVARAFGSFHALTASSEHRFRQRALEELRARGGGEGAERRGARAAAPNQPCAAGGQQQQRGFSTLAPRAAATGGARAPCGPRGHPVGACRGLCTRAAPGAAPPAPTPPPRVVTFSPSHTLVPTHECFNACSYCNFREAVGTDESGWLTVTSARATLAALTAGRGGAPPGSPPAPPPVTEVLVLSGEVSPRTPDRRARWLQRVGDICAAALDAGLLPHANVGPLSEGEMAALGGVNVSMGLMLEQATPRLSKGVHRAAPSKRDPAARLAQLDQAGRLRIPFTTGILCGVGESPDDRLASLEAIAGVARAHGHIGEVIIQPYAPGSTQRDRELAPGMPLEELPALVAAARGILPPDVVIQVPPNLVATPSVLLGCLDAGATDLGGIGPVDVVNPDHPQPLLGELTALLAGAGYALRPRLPLYPRHYGWLPPHLAARLEPHLASA